MLTCPCFRWNRKVERSDSAADSRLGHISNSHNINISPIWLLGPPARMESPPNNGFPICFSAFPPGGWMEAWRGKPVRLTEKRFFMELAAHFKRFVRASLPFASKDFLCSCRCNCHYPGIVVTYFVKTANGRKKYSFLSIDAGTTSTPSTDISPIIRVLHHILFTCVLFHQLFTAWMQVLTSGTRVDTSFLFPNKVRILGSWSKTFDKQRIL